MVLGNTFNKNVLSLGGGIWKGRDVVEMLLAKIEFLIVCNEEFKEVDVLYLELDLFLVWIAFLFDNWIYTV